MNPVREWLRRAAQEAGSPDILRTEALRLKSTNPHVAQLLYRFAARWGAKILRGETVHWASTPKKVNAVDSIPEE